MWKVGQNSPFFSNERHFEFDYIFLKTKGKQEQAGTIPHPLNTLLAKQANTPRVDQHNDHSISLIDDLP